MKPAAFAYERPGTLDGAIRTLAKSANAKILAGGQTLGPMLNLRLAQPELLIDITRIPDLVRVEDNGGSLTLGACITHAAIEDGAVPDASGGFLPRVARGIAYRAVRTRGTIGGSLAHADPAADWLSCFAALGAELSITGPVRRRTARIENFVRGALTGDLGEDEIIDGITLPKLSRKARCGYHKICRKTGEFADAIGVCVIDEERGLQRLVAGATGGAPIIIEAPELFEVMPSRDSLGPIERALVASGFTGDAYETRIHAVALLRAFGEARAA